MDAKTLKIFEDFVGNLAALSKCEQSGQAAIILNSAADQVYSIGINGGPKGGKQCLCNLPGKYTCIHAEAQAIAKCTSTDKDKIMICTMSPCITCASLIVNTGFKCVFYIKEWHDKTGIEILRHAGVICMSVAGFYEASASLVEQQNDAFTQHNMLIQNLLLHIGTGPFCMVACNTTQANEFRDAFDLLELAGHGVTFDIATSAERQVFTVNILNIKEKE